MGIVDKKKQQKRESLLNSAFRLFTENGFHETSISDIAKDAGVAKGTFYLYFSDKFDLRNKLIAHTASKVFLSACSELEANMPEKFDDQIIFLIDNILNQFQTNRQLVYFISKHLSWAVFKNTLLDAEKSGNDEAQIAYTSLIERLNSHYHDAELMVYMIIEFVAGTSYNTILYDMPCSLDELKPHLYGIIRNIMAQYCFNGID